jgi:hypothetical protein
MSADNKDNKQSDDVVLTGEVISEKFAPGSKSEHDAVFLITETGRYKLRRM